MEKSDVKKDIQRVKDYISNVILNGFPSPQKVTQDYLAEHLYMSPAYLDNLIVINIPNVIKIYTYYDAKSGREIIFKNYSDIPFGKKEWIKTGAFGEDSDEILIKSKDDLEIKYLVFGKDWK